MGKYGHITRILVILVLGAAGGLVARHLLLPPGFRGSGEYRVESLQAIMSQPVVHQGEAVCAQCHEDIAAAHDKDVHGSVTCEDCHSPGNRHVAYWSGDDESIGEKGAELPREYTLEGCLFCHRKLTARPPTFPQVDPAEHYAFLHVEDSATRCVECHSPHEPLFLQTPVAKSRIHPTIYECGYCHREKPKGDYHEVADHPVIFVCQDCHPQVVDDFSSRTHSFLRCTACHQFYEENEIAGRIFKNGSRKFCLLCHAKKDFKNTKIPPQIVADEHVALAADALDMDLKKLSADPQQCLACHLENLHRPALMSDKKEVSDE